jgi:tyrosine-protein phosphatase non-receptor type 13 protein
MLPNSNKNTSQPSCMEQGTSSDENEMSDKNKKQCKSPSRKDSYSDSSGSEDDSVKAPPNISNRTWSTALHQTLSNMMTQAQNQHETPKSQEDMICTMFYYPQKIPSKPEFENRYECGTLKATGDISNNPASYISLTMECAICEL